MSVRRNLLLLLAAIGLLAQPGQRRPDPVGDAGAPRWRDGQHGLAAVVLEARAEVLSAKPSDEGVPSTASDGGATPAAVAPVRRWSVSRRLGAARVPDPAADDRVLLAQPHGLVNGSANAHGARA